MISTFLGVVSSYAKASLGPADVSLVDVIVVYTKMVRCRTGIAVLLQRIQSIKICPC